MGYDMHFVQRGDNDYFRLNIWGMARFAGFMAERGMIFEAGPHPDWPKIDEDLHERYRWPEYCEDQPALTDAERQQAEAEDQAMRDVLAWHGPEIPGIPAHKFGSNDGWIVTPAECEAAVRAGLEHPEPEEHEDYWREWLDYLNRARSHGGFEVW